MDDPTPEPLPTETTDPNAAPSVPLARAAESVSRLQVLVVAGVGLLGAGAAAAASSYSTMFVMSAPSLITSSMESLSGIVERRPYRRGVGLGVGLAVGVWTGVIAGVGE